MLAVVSIVSTVVNLNSSHVLTCSVSRREDCVYYDPNAYKASTNGKVGSPTEGPSTQIKNVANALRDVEPTALAGLEALLQLVQASNMVTGTGPGADHNFLSDQAVQVAASALGQLSRQASPGSLTAAGPMAEIINQIRTRQQHDVPDPTPLANLRTHFPNHAITGHLLFHFFEQSSIPWLWPIIHKPIFDACYVTFSSGPQSPPLDFLALLAILCASSLQFLPASSADPGIFYEYGPGRDVLKQRLFEFARSVLLDSNSASPSLERIQALMLLAIYQLNDGNLTDCYYSSAISIRMAQAMSMHLDVSLSWRPDPAEAEIRRRAWWTLFILDRYQCLIHRRPYIIHEHHCDVMMPQDIDQADVQGLEATQSRPSSQPTQTSFQILQIHWARLIGKIWDTCFAAHRPAYRSLVSLESQIQKFELDLPPSFRPQTLVGTMERPYILFQNRMMTLQIYHARAVLLRPFLLLPAEASIGLNEDVANFQAQARYLSIMFSKRLLAWQLIIQNQVDRGQLSWSDIVAWIFDAALILAVAIIGDPTSTQYEELEEWIATAQSLLRDIGTSNVLALRGVKSLDVVRRRTRGAMQPAFDFSSTPTPVISIEQYLQKATHTIAQPQPSMSDLLDVQCFAEPFWQEGVAVYPGHFPGIEVLCDNADCGSIERFLDAYYVPPTHF
ncbi:fungal-specific transcription factor domain-containing protein [Lyophyllum atratum]|nr:fungal-specific transcription factor domain-containing protein [Lyophyllum atratum]